MSCNKSIFFIDNNQSSFSRIDHRTLDNVQTRFLETLKYILSIRNRPCVPFSPRTQTKFRKIQLLTLQSLHSLMTFTLSASRVIIRCFPTTFSQLPRVLNTFEESNFSASLRITKVRSFPLHRARDGLGNRWMGLALI